AEILLVDQALMIDDEGHDARIAVLRRIGHQAETADHLAAHHVIRRTAGCVRPLAGQYSEVIAVIRLRRLAGAIAVRRGVGGEFAGRALVFAGHRRQIEAVLLSRLADDASRVDAGSRYPLVRIVLLRVHIGESGLDGRELIASDAAIEDFLAARRGVELPPAVLAHERNRE